MHLRSWVDSLCLAALCSAAPTACSEPDCAEASTCAAPKADGGSGDGAGGDGSEAPGARALAVTATAPSFAMTSSKLTVAVAVDRSSVDGATGPIHVELDPADGMTAAPLEIPAGSTTGDLEITVGERRHGKVALVVRATSGEHRGTAEALTVVRGAPGSLDTSFGADGVVTVPIAGSEVTGLVVQADGKIALAGRAANDLFVARTLEDGTPDAAFGTNGTTRVAVPGGGTLTATFDLVETSTGALALAFVRTPESSSPAAAIIQWTASGAPDTSFGAGTGNVEMGFSTMHALASLVSDPAGGFFVGGENPASSGQCVVKLAKDGSLATGWGSGGRFVETGPGACLGGPLGCYTRVVVRDVNGDVLSCQPRNDGSRIHRIAADGSTSTQDWNTSLLLDECTALAVDPAAPGYAWVGGDADGAERLAVMRLAASGGFVDAWGTDSDRFVAPDDSGLVIARRLAASDGKLVVAAEAKVGGEAHLAVARLSSLGLLDTTFATKGYVTLKAGGKPSTTKTMALDALGRIVVAGTNGSGVAARFWP